VRLDTTAQDAITNARQAALSVMALAHTTVLSVAATLTGTPSMAVPATPDIAESSVHLMEVISLQESMASPTVTRSVLTVPGPPPRTV
jgi:hypothetical protein